jgi:VanZ family protein
MTNRWALGIAIFWTLFIGTSCFLPPSAFKAFSWPGLFELDKFIHLFIFFFLVVFWILSLRLENRTLKTKIIVVLLCVVYGIAIELIQSTDTIGRSYEFADVIADTIGAILGVLLLPLVYHLMPFIKKYLPFLFKVY